MILPWSRIRDNSSIEISPTILTKGGIQGGRNWNNKDVPIFFSFEIFYLHKVPMIWWMWFGKLWTYIKGKRVVDLVFSKGSKYLRIKFNFFWPSQSLDQFINGRGGKVIAIGSSLSFKDFERSFSLTSWIVSFSNFWIRKRMVCCCNRGWVLFLNVYLGSIGTLVFISWENSPSFNQWI